MKLEFEWHDAKAEANLQAHGVSFDLARTVFKDPFAVERLDDREDYGERRFVIVGMAEGGVGAVCSLHGARGPHAHYFGAEATQNEQDDYFQQSY